MNEEPKYVEVQKFNQQWINIILYIVLIADFLLTLFFLMKKQIVFISFVPLIAALIIFILFRIMRLTVSIDANKIEYAFKPFHIRNQIITKQEIESAQVIKYEPISQYGGWGIRYSFKNGKAFTTSGYYGLQLKLKSGKCILLGTQQPDKLSSFLTACRLSSYSSENDTEKHFPDLSSSS
jgi:hypothetical protein